VILGDGVLVYQALAQGILAPEELASELREAHRLRPDLWHTWVALSRQLAHEGSLEEARLLLEEAGRRFPLLPRIAVERASVERALGDREAQRCALERAVSLSPGWAEAATQLAELLQEAGDYAAERAVLERALRHAPGEAVLRGWLADALRLSGSEPEAKDELERALRTDPGYGWAWDMLVRLCGEGAEAGRPRALAEAVARERPRDARAWVLVARATADIGERLRALDRAIEAQPRDHGAWEMRVDALAEDRRFDEALAATSPPPFGGAPPRPLRLRAVRLEDARGDRPRAIAGLRTLLAAEPDYHEAWQLLADWEEDAGDPQASLKAALELVRLAPHRSVSHGYLGQALLLTGAREDGKAALRRAVELDPAYAWALQRLLEVEIEDRDVDAATRTLALVERHQGEAQARLGRIRLAARLEDRALAVAEFEALAGGKAGWDARAVACAFDGAGWGRDLELALERAMLRNDASSRAAGELWATRTAGAGRWWRGARTLARALGPAPPTPGALGAAVEWMERLASAGRRGAIRALVRRHRAQLQSDTLAWASAGHALCNTGQFRRACAWLASWRGRPQLRPWMLLNLAQSLRDLGATEEGRAVNCAALELPPDHASALHRIHLATDAAPGGPSSLDELALPDEGYYRWLAELHLAYRAGLAGEDRREAWNDALIHLRRAHAGARLTCREPYFRRYRRKVIWAIARRRGGLLAPLWFAAGMAAAGALAER
jgi:tetratricopeptide (TPR) repeat protein